MMSRRTASVGLLTLCFICASSLTTQAQATSCKSTVTGMLAVVPLQSHVYGDNRTLRVWLPPGYLAPANSSKRYPVLYIFDGQDLFDRCTARPGQDEWHVDETVTDLIAKDAVQPLILVGIDNAGPGRREDEYSRYGAMSDAPQKLSAFVTREVLPLVDGRYRTIADRTHRGVGGASLGSIAALSLLLDQPDTFGLGLLESTSLQVGNGKVMQDTSTIVQGPARISIGVGTTEVPPSDAAAHGFPDFDTAFVAMSRTLADNMKKSLMNHPEVKLTVEPGGQHQDKFWGERFGPAITFLYPVEPAQIK
ncbi:alpha/beta hydrolase [Tunturiibacter lichenicola]|uniref:alpha/beta hydrolase n=1 Tax=Tunturiibacter lichenicola TaxID=2051959 RepID=UPI0021B433AF|nr:alpha/beta hydrolase-fold protein [Edaphobacter lichenicola]